ncbi:MAG: hypothetical protein RLZZ292_2287 [Bacteroidota bacterium]|jgi:C1A family cysteine protease
MQQDYILNWKPSPTDVRDKLNAYSMLDNNNPSSAYLGLSMPIYDQGKLGSCTANAIGTAVMIALNAKQNAYFVPSRLFVYYNERAMEGTINEDAGAFIRDGFKSINRDGVCDEKTWKYDEAKFAKKPTLKAYKEASLHKALDYKSVSNTLSELKRCIINQRAVVFGFNVYTSFLSKSVALSGIMPLPKGNEACEGGHAVCVIGYDDVRQAFLVRNSWGKTWGINGSFWMPYSFITSYECDDFWNLNVIS